MPFLTEINQLVGVDTVGVDLSELWFPSRGPVLFQDLGDWIHRHGVSILPRLSLATVTPPAAHRPAHDSGRRIFDGGGAKARRVSSSDG